MKKLIFLFYVCFILTGLASAVTRYVSYDGTDTPPYTNWNTAASWIQPALSLCVAGDTILVTNKDYFIEDEFVVSNGISIIGVYENDYITLTRVNKDSRIFRLFGNSLISGFKLSNGRISGANGGGVFCDDNQPIVSNCIFWVNEADDGGGAYKGTIINSHFILNRAFFNGGGACESILYNCKFSANIAEGNGGGMYGGTAYNCSIIDNDATISGSGVCEGAVYNSIIYHNNLEDMYLSTAYYSCSPGLSGNGNISSDPQIINYSAVPGDYHLQPTSPCINAGTNALAAMPVDLDWNPRIIGGRVDMGAYEYLLPVLHITNTYGIIPYAVTSVTIAGTNNEYVTGTILWSNKTTTANGVVSRSDNSWFAPVSLAAEGNNIITVSGTNIYGVWASDTITIYRETYLEGYLFIDVTNAPVIIPYNITIADVSGTNVNILGNLWWENNRNPGTNTSFTPGFSVQVDNLLPGDNLITLYGTNGFNHITNTSVTVHRKTFEEGYVFINVTNYPPIVSYYSVFANISGTNVNIAGNLHWENERVPGWGEDFSPGFSTSIGLLETGDNTITITGTNAYGKATNDVIIIHRETFLEAYVFIDITNSPGIVSYSSSSAEISGTNFNVSGDLWWENYRHPGDVHNFSPGFSTLINNLEHGDNIIKVFGNNANGHATSDVVTIHRQTYDEAAPRIGTNALIFPETGNIIHASTPTNIIWDVEKITDDIDGTNLTISKISLHYADTTNYILEVTNNIANALGKIEMNIPDGNWGGLSNYVLKFEVVDSLSLTNSRIFWDNKFTVIPEPVLFFIYYLLFIIYYRSQSK